MPLQVSFDFHRYRCPILAVKQETARRLKPPVFVTWVWISLLGTGESGRDLDARTAQELRPPAGDEARSPGSESHENDSDDDESN